MVIYIAFIINLIISIITSFVYFIDISNILSSPVICLLAFIVILIVFNVICGWLLNLTHTIALAIKGYKIKSLWLYPFYFDFKDKKVNTAFFISFIWDINSFISFDEMDDDLEKYEKDYKNTLIIDFFVYVLFSIFTIGFIFIISRNIVLCILFVCLLLSYLCIQLLGQVESMGIGCFYPLINRNILDEKCYRGMIISSYSHKKKVYKRILENFEINSKLSKNKVYILEQILIDSIYNNEKFLSINEEEKLEELLLYNIFKVDYNYIMTWNNGLSI